MFSRTYHLNLPAAARALFQAASLAALLAVWIASSQGANAAEIINRSVVVSSAQTSVTTTHKFSFTYATNGLVGSVVFEYCDNSPLFQDPCVAPPGLDVTNATIANQNGVAGFGVDTIHSTANKLVITRVPINGPPVASIYQFDNITNPSIANQTIFVRISSYVTADASGPSTDSGTVAFATENAFSVAAHIPPYLNFCAAISVTVNCSSSTGASIDLGVLSTAQANAAQSQFAIATNSATGYAIYGLGNTMTSGNNVINNLAVPSASIAGSSQFGINLRANGSPIVGQEPSGLGSGFPASHYNTPNFFMYQPGDMLAASSLPTDFNRMTVSYLVNVSDSQAVGVYATTISYLAVAQF